VKRPGRSRTAKTQPGEAGVDEAGVDEAGVGGTGDVGRVSAARAPATGRMRAAGRMRARGFRPPRNATVPDKDDTTRAGGNEPVATKKVPLYPRLLRLRHIRPNVWQRALLGEGALALAVLLVLADLATTWTLLVLPVAVAAVVKANDVLAGLLANEERAGPRPERKPATSKPAKPSKPATSKPAKPPKSSERKLFARKSAPPKSDDDEASDLVGGRRRGAKKLTRTRER